jgi:hypothetical protein
MLLDLDPESAAQPKHAIQTAFRSTSVSLFPLFCIAFAAAANLAALTSYVSFSALAASWIAFSPTAALSSAMFCFKLALSAMFAAAIFTPQPQLIPRCFNLLQRDSLETASSVILHDLISRCFNRGRDSSALISDNSNIKLPPRKVILSSSRQHSIHSSDDLKNTSNASKPEPKPEANTHDTKI